MQAYRVNNSADLVRLQQERRERMAHWQAEANRQARYSRWNVLGRLGVTAVAVLALAALLMAMAVIGVGMFKAGGA